MAEAATHIRPASAADLPALAELYRAFFAEIGVAVPERLERNILGLIEDRSAALVLLETGAAPAGLASASMVHGVEFGTSAEIEDIYVAPAHRRQGLGGRLLAEMLAWCRAKGAAVVGVVVPPQSRAEPRLGAFYARHGFRESGRVVMLLDLADEPAAP